MACSARRSAAVAGEGRAHQALDLLQQRPLRRCGDAYRQRAGCVECPGIDRVARGDPLRAGLARDEALVEIGRAVFHHTVHRDALARPHQYTRARRDRRKRHVLHRPIRAKEGGGLATQGGEIFRERARATAHGLIEHPPDQEKEDEHDGAVEIGMLSVAQRLGHRHAQREHDAERDREVHGEASRPQAPERPLVKRLAGIGGGRQRDHRLDPVEQIAGFRRDVGHVAGPDRDCQQHHVHRGEARDGERAHKLSHLRRLGRVPPARVERPGSIAARLQHRDKPADRLRRALPFDEKAAVRDVKARAHHAGQPRRHALDRRDAGGTGHAFQREFDAVRPVRQAGREGGVIPGARVALHGAPMGMGLGIGTGEVAAAHRHPLLLSPAAIMAEPREPGGAASALLPPSRPRRDPIAPMPRLRHGRRRAPAPPRER